MFTIREAIAAHIVLIARATISDLFFVSPFATIGWKQAAQKRQKLAQD
jgi:hypothetical protein